VRPRIGKDCLEEPGMIFGNYAVCLFLPFFICVLLFFAIKIGAVNDNTLKKLEYLHITYRLNYFVHASLTREEGNRSLEHSDRCRHGQQA
jgi:hypothetical protein